MRRLKRGLKNIYWPTLFVQPNDVYNEKNDDSHKNSNDRSEYRKISDACAFCKDKNEQEMINR